MRTNEFKKELETLYKSLVMLDLDVPEDIEDNDEEDIVYLMVKAEAAVKKVINRLDVKWGAK